MNAHVATLVILTAALPACADWPPALSTRVQCGDVMGFVTFTLDGVWRDSCIPQRASAERRNDGSILVTVHHEYPPGTFCLSVLRPYTVEADLIVGDGDYAVWVALDSTLIDDAPPAEFGRLGIRCLPRCIPDFNDDGGIDGGDVEAFFHSWEAGQQPADVNYDGGVDGADVQAFFEAWETGGC